MATVVWRYEWASLNWRIRHLVLLPGPSRTACGLSVTFRDRQARVGVRLCKRCDAYRTSGIAMPDKQPPLRLERAN